MQKKVVWMQCCTLFLVVLPSCSSDATDDGAHGRSWQVGVGEETGVEDDDDPGDPDPHDTGIVPPPVDTRVCPGVAVCPYHRLDIEVLEPDGSPAREFQGDVRITTVFEDDDGTGGGGGGQVLRVDCPDDGPSGMIQCDPPDGPDGVRIRLELIDENSRVSSVHVDFTSPAGSVKSDVSVQRYEETVETAPGCTQTCKGTRGSVQLENDDPWTTAGLTETCGPADGRAYRLVFGTQGSNCNPESTKRVRIYVWDNLPTQDNPTRTLQLREGVEGDGRATFCDAQGCRVAPKGQIEFTDFVRGEAVSGSWLITRQDGSTAGAAFDAGWCGSDNCI